MKELDNKYDEKQTFGPKSGKYLCIFFSFKLPETFQTAVEK